MLSIVARPWFWVVVVGALWLLPLIKSLGAELPDPLPGMDGVPVVLHGTTERGERVALADLAGYLVLATSTSLADGEAADRALSELRKLRKRLRGLGSSVIFLVLVLDAEVAELGPLLDANGLRKPTEVFLIDASGDALEALRAAGGAVRRPPDSEPGGDPEHDPEHDPQGELAYFLLDTRGRIRGAYVDAPAALDCLVTDAGQVANWRASDPPLAAPDPEPAPEPAPEPGPEPGPEPSADVGPPAPPD